MRLEERTIEGPVEMDVDLEPHERKSAYEHEPLRERAGDVTASPPPPPPVPAASDEETTVLLTPEQAVVLPVSERFNEYAQQVVNLLEMSDIRALVDDRNEKVGRKIRDAEVRKVPFMLVVGEKEQESQTVSVRRHGEGDLGAETPAQFAERVRAEVAQRLAAL
jgi:hypothetical protein